MEFLNWKNILLEWANRLEFFGRPYYSLNLAEIESFYNEFKTKVTSVNIASKSLDSFIKHFYPEFRPIHNKEGKICPDDYVYGYSLLMYFSCVTHPDEKMHKICKTMQEETQLIIKTFLQNLLECGSFSREAIKAVIESSAPAKLSDYVLILSPNKTNEVDICPPTPKTKILNEWNTENRQLKALVETERYEKGFLEIQLKKKEEQINVLTQERRKFVTDIQELKSQISERDLANIPPNECAQTESLKRRLRKEVSDRDEEIKDLQNQVNDLTTAKQHLAEKLSYLQSQYNISIASTNDLTVRLNDVSEECEKQLQHIKGLEITIKEYQKYFNESNSKGSSLNASSDNLDDSYAIAMANISNRSMSSPENLGKVVDIQLREQVLLYENLLNQYNQIQKEKSVLNEQIEERAQKISALESKCRHIEDENSSNVKRYEDKLEELAASSKKSEANLKELQLLRIEFDSLISKVNESHQRIEDLNGTKTSLEQQLKISENIATELRNTNQTMSNENVNHICHIERLAASEKKLKLELENANESINCLQSSVVQLKGQLEMSHEREVSLQSEVDRLTKLVDDLLTQIDRLKADNQTLSEDYTVSLNDKDVALKKLKEDRNALMVDLEHQVQLVSELTVQIDSVKAKLFTAESSKTDLQCQFEEIHRQSNSELAEIKKERDCLSAQVSELKTCLSDAETIKIKLLSQNGELVMEMEKERNVLSSEVRNLSADLINVQNSLIAAEALQNELLTTNLALTQQLTNKKNEIEKMIEESNDRKNESDSLNEAVVNLRNQIHSLEVKRQIFDATLTELTSANQLVNSENAQLRKQLSTIEVMRVDLEAQLSQSEEEKERLFLNLQEKIDEAEATELTMKNLTQQCKAEAAKCDDLIEKNKANNDVYVAKVKDLEKLVCELTALTQNLSKTNETLNEEIVENHQSLTHLQSELEIMHKNAEQHSTEEKQFLDSIEQLTTSTNAKEKELNETRLKLEMLDDKIRLLEQTLAESENGRMQLEKHFQESETENQKLQKCTADFQAKRDQLMARIESAERAVVNSREDLRLKHQEVADLLKEVDASKTKSSTILDDKTVVEANLQKNLDLVKQLTEELKQNKVDLGEKLQSINSLSDQIAPLKNDRKKLDKQLQDSQIENQNLKESVQNLQAERDELTIGIESTERELVNSREDSRLKSQEVAVLLSKIDELKSGSEIAVAEKSNVEANLQNNLELLKQLTDELQQNKVDIGEKLKLIDSLSDQIAQLKSVESSMVAESNKLSEKLKELNDKLETVESSRDTLSVKHISLEDELKVFEVKYNDLENKLVDRSVTETSRNEAVKLLEIEVDKLKQQIDEMTEVANREQSDLTTKLEMNRKEITAVSRKAEENEIQRSATIEQLKQTIAKLNLANESLLNANEELTNQLSHRKINIESHQQSTDYKTEIEGLIKDKEILNLRVNYMNSETEKLRKDLATARQENVSLTDENIDLATEIEEVRKEYSTSRLQINSLETEVNRLVSENHHHIEELQKAYDTKCKDTSYNEYVKLEADLKVALTDLESKMQECHQAQEIHKQLVNDNKILSAKLTKHREMTQLREEEWRKERSALEERSQNVIKENRFELEGKLIKMKEKMKHIYTEETSKAKEKHETQERELSHYKSETVLLAEKIEKYDTHVRSISKQLYKLNEQNLEVKKENEFLKNKLRLAESNPRESRLFSAQNFGSNFKMEDEEGEIFNNTYLADLKSGVSRTSPTGRESIRKSELNLRNSMAARHLRSTYAAQYGDQNLREEDISMPYFNDSMFSNQLDVRRGTLYQRPGPPTPSKNGGRLSFGGSNVTASELFPKEVLREQNNNVKTKTTPGKLMSMFSSSKHKETVQRKSINRPIYSTFTSTPRQKSNWARGRNSILSIKPFSSQLTETDDDAASNSSNNSLLSKTSHKRKSITRSFSIISKQRHGSAITNMITKNRREYREKNHSKRLKGFEESRDIFSEMNAEEDFQMLKEKMACLQQNELFPMDFAPSEKFEFLAKHTTSEHPYSNEPTEIEANESSTLSSSFCQSKTMSNIVIYGKIPRIKVNESPHRELIRLKHHSGSIWFRLMKLTKQVVFILIVVYVSYVMTNFLIRKND